MFVANKILFEFLPLLPIRQTPAGWREKTLSVPFQREQLLKVRRTGLETGFLGGFIVVLEA